MALSQIQDTSDELYYENLIWAIIDDMCRHFNEPLVMTDFENSAGMGAVMWLEVVCMQLVHATPVEPAHLPTQVEQRFGLQPAPPTSEGVSTP